MKSVNFGELAETVTDAKLPDFLYQLFTRPGTQDLNYTALIIEAAADTLGRKPFSVFREYQGLAGERMPELATRLWKISFPVGVLDIKSAEPMMGVILQFHVDRVRKSTRKNNNYFQSVSIKEVNQ